jgi:hypothetical protein
MGDERFKALSSDPRYRLPSRKEARTAVDPRFGSLFKNKDFHNKASVDRYGRKIKSESKKKTLERLYRLENEDKPNKKKAAREVVGSSDESEDDEESGGEEQVVKKRDPARDGGFSESESDEDTSSDEDESEAEAELAEETAGQEQTESIPMGEVTTRIAAVNLDWDNIRAMDMMKVASSFVPTGGRIERVAVYPSEFGRERLEKEELEGPPKEIFANAKRGAHDEEDEDGEEGSEDEDEDERIKKRLLQQQANEGDEFDTAKLREYQLERLRYYYAVIECDTKPTAKALYDAMDGREYLTTANFFDLRFIPEETSFEDDKPREECTVLPEGYKPNEFRTEALTHSKVRLTWDDDDTTRKEVQKRAFSRAELDDNDLQAYIGTDDSDADSVTSRKSAGEDRKAKKREAERAKMRAALGLGDAPMKSKRGKDEPVGDMEITFTSGLSTAKHGNGVFENEPQDEESTRDRYIRKERERKQKRKEKMKASRTGGKADSDSEAAAGPEKAEAEEQDAGFDDPFFTDPSTSAALEKKAKKLARQKKREAEAAEEEEKAAKRKELALLMADDEADNVRHFDIREIEKAEKAARKKGKKGKKNKKHADEEETKDEFEIDTKDPRFSKVLESHEYAIDPTNPKFKATQGMKTVLEEGRKKRKAVVEEDGEEVEAPKAVKKSKKGSDVGLSKEGNGDDLKGLVARLKGNSKGKSK